MNRITLSDEKIERLQQGRVFIPSPLVLDEGYGVMESWQRLLTLYYIRSGAAAVVPGAHTGEFALNDLEIYRKWLEWVGEMTRAYGSGMILMAAAGGKDVLRQAEIAANFGYDLLMISPTAFSGRNREEVIELMRDLSSLIPVFGFELQRAIPGAWPFDRETWELMFGITYGAKGASFNTYRSLQMMEAAANSAQCEKLTLLTGNDDRIVTDLLGVFDFVTGTGTIRLQYHGGLLGHWATDTKAAVRWVNQIFDHRNGKPWVFPMNDKELAHAVNRCNMVLFDALGNFENSVWGVKYRLSRLGLIPKPICRYEEGREGQAEAIDRTYDQYPDLKDDDFIREHLENMYREVGIRP